jgi:RNA polymerase sigma factor (sigma-70 family)
MDLIKKITPLVTIMARERTGDRPHLYDDARQEGLIRAWEREQQKPGQKTAYYYVAARGGVVDHLRGRPTFGAPRHAGVKDAHESAHPLTVLGPDGQEHLITDPEDLSTADAFGATEIGQAVRDAVAGLSERDRLLVYLCYWEDLSFAQASEILGRSSNALQLQWRNTIRPRLREELSELAG